MEINQLKQNIITEVRRLIKEQATPISRADLIDKIKEYKGKFEPLKRMRFIKQDNLKGGNQKPSHS